jgi:hypothetical protein
MCLVRIASVVPKNEYRRSRLKAPSLFLVIIKEVYCVLIQVLPPALILHDGLRVFVLTHHLPLPRFT